MAIERYIRERFIMTHKDFQWDSKCSKEAFIKFIAPDLSKKYKIKSIRAAESSGDEMFELMDMQSGIDYFVIDCRNSGKVQTIAPQFKTLVLKDTVHGMDGNTPWMWLGNWPILILLAGGLLFFRFSNRS